jgi:hypothetical protein
MWVLPSEKMVDRCRSLLFASCRRCLCVPLADLLNCGFVVPVDLFGFLSFRRDLAGRGTRLLTDVKLMNEKGSESGNGCKNPDQQLRS